MPHVVKLREAPHKRSMLEREMRYEVLLNGKVHGELYYNMTGYVGSLPLPNGRSLSIGERGISAYKKEIGIINREAREEELKAASAAAPETDAEPEAPSFGM